MVRRSTAPCLHLHELSSRERRQMASTDAGACCIVKHARDSKLVSISVKEVQLCFPAQPLSTRKIRPGCLYTVETCSSHDAAAMMTYPVAL